MEGWPMIANITHSVSKGPTFWPLVEWSGFVVPFVRAKERGLPLMLNHKLNPFSGCLAFPPHAVFTYFLQNKWPRHTS
jgi:hypothetical protein